MVSDIIVISIQFIVTLNQDAAPFILYILKYPESNRMKQYVYCQINLTIILDESIDPVSKVLCGKSK